MTGISILTTGYAKIYTISVYHLQIVIYLAWMSSGTHLITLSVLRKYFREKSMLRISRVAGMTILFVMLFVAILPTRSNTYNNIVSGNLQMTGFNASPATSWYLAGGVPSSCFWHRRYWNGYDWAGAGFSDFLLISSYVVQAVALFESSEKFFKRNLRDRLLQNLGRVMDRTAEHAAAGFKRSRGISCAQRLIYHTCLGIYAVTLACMELYSSFLASLLWVLAILIWGTLRMLIPRMIMSNASKMTTAKGEPMSPWNTTITQETQEAITAENAWGFGQIIPLMLLALPIIAAIEAYHGLSNSDQSQDSDIDLHTESPRSSDNNHAPLGSPRKKDPQKAQEMGMIQSSPTLQPPTGHMTHEQHDHHDDTLGGSSNEHLVRADTEQRQGDEDTSARQLNFANLHLVTSPLLVVGKPDNSMIFEESPTGRADHQDFYASKWFKFIQISIIINMILCFTALCFIEADSWNTAVYFAYIIIVSFFVLLCVIVGGMFRSNFLRKTLKT